MKLFSDNQWRISYSDSGPVAGGPDAVVLLHASASSHFQWGEFIRKEAGARRCVAPDLIGYGSTRDQEAVEFSISREVVLLRTLTSQFDRPFHLVGHSYGGSVALHYALCYPADISSLSLIEPVAFNLLRASGDLDAWIEIAAVACTHLALVEAGEYAQAAEQFIGYWAGRRVWQVMPEDLRAAIVATMPKVAEEWRQMWLEPGFSSRLADLRMPIHLISGSDTAKPARAVMDILASRISTFEHECVEGAGHLAPITHGWIVDRMITDFLRRSEIDTLMSRRNENSGIGADG